MGFWQKEYWLHIWKNARGKVDEKQQLRNASNYYRKHQDNPNFIAKLEKDINLNVLLVVYSRGVYDEQSKIRQKKYFKYKDMGVYASYKVIGI